MKSKITRLATLASASTATLMVTSCATTGDPSTGGIFWSEQKAQKRLVERQDKLEHIERQTGRSQHNAAETQRAIDQLQ